MSALSDRSTRQVALVGGVAAIIGIALIARSRRKGSAPAQGAEGELESWYAAPACASIVRTDGWSRERRDVVSRLVSQEIERAKLEGNLADPRTVANQFIRKVSPECPANPPVESAAYEYWLDTAEEARALMLCELPEGSVAPLGSDLF